MAERADITVVWQESPRLIDVAYPSAALVTQDLHDTLNSNTLPAGMADDSLEQLDDDVIIDSSGKEDLGSGKSVGITSTLQNGQVAFGRPPSISSGTVTTADVAGKVLTDSTATFQTDGVQRGYWVINFTDQSVTEVLETVSETELRCRALSDGADNQFDLNDVYKVWEVKECAMSGGNVVAVDSGESAISPLFPTFGTFARLELSSSATLLQGSSPEDIWAYSLIEDYPPDGQSSLTPTQILYAVNQMLSEFARAGVLISVKKRDGTQAFELTLDSATAPTTSTQSA